MRWEWDGLWFQSGTVDAYESISWDKYVNWLSMSQIWKSEVIESIVIGNMIL